MWFWHSIHSVIKFDKLQYITTKDPQPTWQTSIWKMCFCGYSDVPCFCSPFVLLSQNLQSCTFIFPSLLCRNIKAHEKINPVHKCWIVICLTRKPFTCRKVFSRYRLRPFISKGNNGGNFFSPTLHNISTFSITETTITRWMLVKDNIPWWPQSVLQ